MYTARNYVRPATLEEAWALNQKRANAVLGGGCWLRLGRRRLDTVIDLSGLGLEEIREETGAVVIGAMATLRQLEQDERLQAAFGRYFQDCTAHIVGVQFRNCATVGGSVRARFGFSDLVTALLPLGCTVLLYRGGEMPLEEYLTMGYDRDLLLGVRVPLDGIASAAYESARNSETDLPVLTCAAARRPEGFFLAVGARPGRAMLLKGREETALIEKAAALPFGSNLRAGADYRRHLARVLARRALKRRKHENHTDAQWRKTHR